MKKEVRLYHQTMDSCGACSLMMALDSFGKLKSSKEKEEELHEMSSSVYTMGNHFSGLALIASLFSVESVLMHSEAKMFKQPKDLSDELFGNLMIEYSKYLDEAKKLGTRVESGIDVSSELVRKLLKLGYLIILAGQLSDGNYHAVLIHDHDPRGFTVSDPLWYKHRIFSDRDFKTFVKTPIGSWLLAVKDK